MLRLWRRWKNRCRRHEFRPTTNILHCEDWLAMPEGGFMDVGWDEREYKCIHCGKSDWDRIDV